MTRPQGSPERCASGACISPAPRYSGMASSSGLAARDDRSAIGRKRTCRPANAGSVLQLLGDQPAQRGKCIAGTRVEGVAVVQAQVAPIAAAGREDRSRRDADAEQGGALLEG